MSKEKEEKKKAICKKNSFGRVLILELILVFLCLFFYLIGINCLHKMKQQDGIVTFFAEETMTYADAEQMRKINNELEDVYDYTLWGNDGRHSLENQDLGREVSANVYLMEGRSDLVFASNVILDNSFDDCCLIGKHIADALFGIDDATGLYIAMDGRMFKVLGMLEDESNAAVFPAKNLPDGKTERMNVILDNVTSVSSLKQELQMELDFNGYPIDYRFMNSMVGFLAAGLWILMGIHLYRVMKREVTVCHNQVRSKLTSYEFKYGDHTDYYKGMALRIAGTVVILGILVFFIMKTMNIPEDMIPTRWSDLEFWKRLYDEKAEALLLYIRSEKYDPDLRYLISMAFALLAFTASYVMYLIKYVNEGLK